MTWGWFVIWGLIPLAFAPGYWRLAQRTKRHKAEMDAHDREFAKYSWAVPINAKGPGSNYAWMWGHIIVGLALIITGLAVR